MRELNLVEVRVEGAELEAEIWCQIRKESHSIKKSSVARTGGTLTIIYGDGELIKTGFHLKPVGFFDQNPILDVPPSAHSNGHCYS